MKEKKEHPNEGEESNIEDYEIVDELEDGEADSASKLKKVKIKLQTCNKERQEYLAGWQRARADLINERKELEGSVGRTADNAQKNLILDLLAVLDSFDMAFSNKEAWEKVDSNWRSGVEHIHTHFLSVLAQYGFVPFRPLNEKFNPNEHESLGTIPIDDKKKVDTVAEVLQSGYKRGEEILRPAKVKVAVYKG